MRHICIVIFLLVVIYSLGYSQGANQQKFQLAEGYENSGDYKNAVRLYEELFKSDPSNDNFFYGVVRTRKALNQYSELLPIIEKKLSLKKSADLFILYGEMLWRVGKVNEAMSNWNKAIKDYGRIAETYLMLAETQTNLMLFDKAIETLLIGRKELKSREAFADELSQLYLAIGDVKNGVEEVMILFEVWEDFGMVQGKLQAFLVLPQAETYINDYLLKKVQAKNDIEYYKLYAWFLRAIKKFEQSLEYYIKIDKLFKNNSYEVYNFAEASRKDGNIDIALKAYSYVIDNSKSQQFVMSALYGYANALEEKIRSEKTLPANFVEEVINRYKNIVKTYPNTNMAYNSTYRIAYLYYAHLKDNASAKAELNKILNINDLGTALRAKLLLGEIYLAENAFEEAQTVLFDVLKFGKNRQFSSEVDRAKFLRAEILFFNGLIDSSQNAYAEIALNPASDYANDALAKITFIERFKAQNKAINLYAQAQLKEKQGKYDEAIELYRKAGDADASGDLAEICLFNIMEVYFNTGRFELSIKSFEELIQKYPDHIYLDKAMMLIGDAYVKLGNNEQALKMYNGLLNKFQYSIYLQEAREKIRKLRSYQ